jgi:hypothetical protein
MRAARETEAKGHGSTAGSERAAAASQRLAARIVGEARRLEPDFVRLTAGLTGLHGCASGFADRSLRLAEGLAAQLAAYCSRRCRPTRRAS